MVQLNPFNVIMLVYVTFSALNLSTSPITSKEQEMAHKIESMLKEMRDERYEMEVEESLDYENDNDIPTAEQFELGDEEEEGELLDANPKVICTTDASSKSIKDERSTARTSDWRVLISRWRSVREIKL
nr:PREDICTED: uncharacterized protein LOC105676575 [Linepithema humile]